MRVLREVVIVRFEGELAVSVGELRNLEDEFEKLSPKEFIAAWVPEVRDVRLMIKMKERVYAAKNNRADQRKSNKAKQQQLPFSPEDDGTRRENREALA